MDEKELKAQIFDILEQQELSQRKIQELEPRKQELLRQLNELRSGSAVA